MKPYGHSRRDTLECKFGCCTDKSGKARSSRDKVDKTNRKTARQFGIHFILTARPINFLTKKMKK